VVFCVLTLPFTGDYVNQLFSFNVSKLLDSPPGNTIQTLFDFQGGLGFFAMSLPYGCWCYLGVEMLPGASEEAKAMDKEAPRSIMSGLGILALLTLLILATVPGAPPGSAGLAGSLEPFVDSLLYNYHIPRNSALATFLSLVNLIGTLATLHCVVWCYSRQIYSLSRGGHLPPVLSLTTIPFEKHISKFPRLAPAQRFFFQRGIPHLAQWSGTAVVFILSNIFHSISSDSSTVNMILNISVLVSLFAYFTESCSFIVLRSKMKQLPRPFKSPLGVATGYISATISLSTIVLNAIFSESMRSALLLIAGSVGVLMIYYFLFARKRLLLSPEKVFIKAQMDRKLKNNNVSKLMINNKPSSVFLSEAGAV
jgi:ethanolamine permease